MLVYFIKKSRWIKKLVIELAMMSSVVDAKRHFNCFTFSVKLQLNYSVYNKQRLLTSKGYFIIKNTFKNIAYACHLGIFVELTNFLGANKEKVLRTFERNLEFQRNSILLIVTYNVFELHITYCRLFIPALLASRTIWGGKG